ncbi:MAG: tetratricopeptide repeat protein [Gammaproteobacteria bacterium]
MDTHPGTQSHGRRHVLNVSAGIVGILAASFVCLPAAVAAERAIADVQFSRQGTQSSAKIALGCRMRYLDHTPKGGGTEVRIRFVLEAECRSALSGVRNELYRPPGRRMGLIEDLEFESFAIDNASLIVRFEEPIAFSVSQGALLNQVRVTVDTALPVAQTAVEPPPVAVPVTTPPTSRSLRREPLQPVVTSPPPDAFVIQIATYADGVPIDVGALPLPTDSTLYTQPVTIGDREWTALRLGFFSSEDAALAAMAGITPSNPGAFVAFAEAEERAAAVDRRAELLATASPRMAPPPDELATSSMSEDRIAELMAEAKQAMRRRDYDRSVQIYMRVLEEPDVGQRKEALEFLGVAREKKGQPAQARAEYENFLTEFPDGTDAERVRQRLAGLIAMYQAPQQQARIKPADAGADWNVYGGLSQYYRRDVSQFDTIDESIVNQSAILSHADLILDRRGNRFDLQGRMSASYHYDLLEEGLGPGDQGFVYFAYLDVADQQSGITARLGRQSRYTDGVLGRFDGAHVRYRWRPDISINFTAGFPVYSPRYAFETRRAFVGASMDIENVADAWDFSFFTHQQQIDGIYDRQAVGSEARFFNDRWNLVGLLDYDASYNVLNSAMFVGNWQATDRLTLSGRYDFRAYPFITSGNALIGQPVATMDELLDLYSEPQVRGLARDRTAQASSSSIGFSTPISERFQLSGDFVYSEIANTVASGGVAATPGTGPQYFFLMNVIGSSLFEAGDTTILSLRYRDTRAANMSTAIVDLRYPLTERLRISPRLGVSLRQDAFDDTTQWIIRPNLRLIYRWRNRFRLELEAGGLWSRRELPDEPTTPVLFGETEDSSAYYVNGGYWVDF